MKEKLVTVARFGDYLKADLARQWLEDEGIKAFVMGQNVGNVWGGAPASDIELQTTEGEAKEAREILAAHAPEGGELGEDEDFDEDEPDLDEGQEDEQE
jgi:hypothetical protein